MRSAGPGVRDTHQQMRHPRRAVPGPNPSGLVASMALLAVVIVFALVGLATVGNWSKFSRVAAAALTYGAVLLALSRGTASPRPGMFVIAGAAAGAVNGFARPGTSAGLVVASIAGAVLLLAPLHWAALRSRTRILQRRPPLPAFHTSARARK